MFRQLSVDLTATERQLELQDNFQWNNQTNKQQKKIYVEQLFMNER